MDVAQFIEEAVSIAEAMGIPAIVGAAAPVVIAKIASRGGTEIGDGAREALKGAKGRDWLFVGCYESNRALVRDKALQKIVLLRETCADKRRGTGQSHETERVRGNDNDVSEAPIIGDEYGGTVPFADMKGRRRSLLILLGAILLCVLISLPIVIPALPLLRQWQTLVERLSSVVVALSEHSDLWPTCFVAVILLVASVMVRLGTDSERKYLNGKMHSTLPVVTFATLMLSFLLGAALSIDIEMRKSNVDVLGGWILVLAVLVLITAVPLVVYAVVARGVAEEYAIRESCPERFFEGPLDPNSLADVYRTMTWFRGVMTASQFLYMETALMVGWSFTSVALAAPAVTSI